MRAADLAPDLHQLEGHSTASACEVAQSSGSIQSLNNNSSAPLRGCLERATCSSLKGQGRISPPPRRCRGIRFSQFREMQVGDLFPARTGCIRQTKGPIDVPHSGLTAGPFPPNHRPQRSREETSALGSSLVLGYITCGFRLPRTCRTTAARPRARQK